MRNQTIHLTAKICGTAVLICGFLLINSLGKPETRNSVSLTSPSSYQGVTPLQKEVSHLLERALRQHGERWSQSQFKSAVRGITDVVKLYDFSPSFVLGLIKTESSFRIDAVSPVGAVGLTQVIPSTADLTSRTEKIPYSGVEDLYDPGKNIRIGFAYLNWMRETYGSIEAALVAYNCGPAILERRGAEKGLPKIPYRRDVWNAERAFSFQVGAS